MGAFALIELGCGVFALTCSTFSRVFFIPEISTLIDTGLPFLGESILREIAVSFPQSTAIHRILLTHHDADHSGNAGFLQRQTGARVYIGKADADILLHPWHYPGLKAYAQNLLRQPPPEQLFFLEEAEGLDGIACIATPGHTPGHHSFVFRDILLSGDVFAYYNGRIYKKSNYGKNSVKRIKSSFNKLFSLDFSCCCPSHGEPFYR